MMKKFIMRVVSLVVTIALLSSVSVMAVSTGSECSEYNDGNTRT